MQLKAANIVGGRRVGAASLDCRTGCRPDGIHPHRAFILREDRTSENIHVEQVSGQTLGKYFEDNITKPLGMTDTGFFIPADKAARYAKALPVDPDKRQTADGVTGAH